MQSIGQLTVVGHRKKSYCISIIFLKSNRCRKLVGLYKVIYKVKWIRAKVVTQSVFWGVRRRECSFLAGGILEGRLQEWLFYLGFESPICGPLSLLRIWIPMDHPFSLKNVKNLLT